MRLTFHLSLVDSGSSVNGGYSSITSNRSGDEVGVRVSSLGHGIEGGDECRIGHTSGGIKGRDFVRESVKHDVLPLGFTAAICFGE